MSRSGETTTAPSKAPRAGQATAGKPGRAGRAPAEIFGCFVGTLAKLESSGTARHGITGHGKSLRGKSLHGKGAEGRR